LAVIAMGYLSPRLGHPQLTAAFTSAVRPPLGFDREECWENALLQAGWGGGARPWLEGLWRALCEVEREARRLVTQPLERWTPEEWEGFAACCSLPVWIARRWLDNPWYRPTPAQILQLCRALCVPAAPCLRVNTLRASRDSVLRALRQQGVEALPTVFSPVGIRLGERVALQESKLYRDGIVEIQEEGSQLVGYAVAPCPGWRLWDACAGAGGKTLHLAVLQEDCGEIWATDVELARLRALRQRLRRARIGSVQVVHLRHGVLPRHFPRSFDALLLDAPCSGLGTVRRTPTLKWRLTPEALRRHCQRQLRLLELYSPLVRPGGVLVYATCSLMPEENFGIASQFAKAHPEWELEPIEPTLRSAGILLPNSFLESPYCLLVPSVHGTDGFFIARFRRRFR
ncbi:MAG: RsmB/NOP family class I SAM-dependent RNA methyltransferase, partial [Candidatus Kapabacteria bacterium]|nr:RsmB/NOP family class I SAM-dependent RNA methyltransferase [Candidatus Kapabacteria bacterium]MDW7996452.1 RsmB/NOP family class I SAM-dependent RNA methyltransferase [Bacteroidota bacterium]